MSRVAAGATLALLDKLEPEAQALWEEEVFNLPEAVAASLAITSRTQASVQLAGAQANADAQTIKLKELEAANSPVVAALPAELTARYPRTVTP